MCDQLVEQPPKALDEALSVSVIIPTKNRVDDLFLTVQTLLQQTVLPDELIVVDQNESDACEVTVKRLFHDADQRTKLRYVHDPKIHGGATARNVAIAESSGSVLLFLDDDVELERDFLEQLLETYKSNPGATGVSGVVTNYHAPSIVMRLWKRTFMRGPFRDDRELFYWKAAASGNPDLGHVTRLGGGLMSFRASAIGEVRFDDNLRGVSDGEDVDFCMHLGQDSDLLINPRARLVHHPSSAGRTKDHWIRRYVRGQVYLYWRNWDRSTKNRLCLFWFLIGAGVMATGSAVFKHSLHAWRSLLLGYKDGIAAANHRGGMVAHGGSTAYR